MDDIINLIERLSWKEDVATQEEAIRQLVTGIEDDKIYLLIQPGDDKSRWENAARVLKGIGSPRINREIPKLLEWLADLNWPGAMTVMELLATMDIEVLVPYVAEAREKAVREADEMWLDALDQLLESLSNSDRVQ